MNIGGASEAELDEGPPRTEAPTLGGCSASSGESFSGSAKAALEVQQRRIVVAGEGRGAGRPGSQSVGACACSLVVPGLRNVRSLSGPMLHQCARCLRLDVTIPVTMEARPLS